MEDLQPGIPHKIPCQKERSHWGEDDKEFESQLVQETENYVRLAVIMAVVMSKPKDTTLEEYVTYLKNKLESYVSPNVCEANDTQQDFEQTVLSIQQEDLISKIRNIVINPQSLTQCGESAAAARAVISNDTTRHKPTSTVVRVTDSLDEAVSNVQFIQAIIDLKTAANEDSTVPVEDVHRILSLAPSETVSDQDSGVISSASIQYLTRTRPVNDLLLRSVERVLSGLSCTILRAGLDRLDKCVRSYQGSSEQYIADTVSSLLDVLCGRTEQYYECVDTCLSFVKEMIETMLVRTGCQSGELPQNNYKINVIYLFYGPVLHVPGTTITTARRLHWTETIHRLRRTDRLACATNNVVSVGIIRYEPIKWGTLLQVDSTCKHTFGPRVVTSTGEHTFRLSYIYISPSPQLCAVGPKWASPPDIISPFSHREKTPCENSKILPGPGIEPGPLSFMSRCTLLTLPNRRTRNCGLEVHLVLEKQCTIILELSKNRYLCDKVISYTSDQILELATCVQKRSTKLSEAIKDSITQQESRLERSFYLFHLTENLLVEYKQIHGEIVEKKRRVKQTVANTRAAVPTGNYVSEWRNKWFNEIATESFEEKEYKESLRCLCGWEDSLRRSAVMFTETRAHLLSVYSWQCVELIKSFY
uniref:Uncharacterized protein n=1 Tax=Timema poppense TaxID=170557 RepID=A0A7R9DB83_TIMPO|nr:unnamed protein product [Timema poppensis]